METLIFFSIFATLCAMLAGRRRLAIGLFLVSLSATAVLFSTHATSTLNLVF